MLGRLATHDPDQSVRNAAWQALQQHREHVGVGFFRNHWGNTDERVRAAALAAAAGKPQVAMYQEDLLEACRDKSVLVRHALAATAVEMPSTLSRNVYAVLANDPHSSVRGAVADGIGQAVDQTLVPLLLRLADDSDAEVRRRAVAQLFLFRRSDCLHKAVARFDDPSRFVREQAEESAVELFPHTPVAKVAGNRLQDPHPITRYHVFRVLGRIGATPFAKPIAEQLEIETRPENVAAAVYALGQLNARFAANAVARRGAHEHGGVRASVAFALGEFKVLTTYDVLKTLALDKESDDTRQEALHSVGRTGAGDAFNDTVLQALKQVTLTSANNRAAAAWAAGRLRPTSDAVADRLVIQATKAVIPVPMSPPTFDSDLVLVSCAFALAQCARDDSAYERRAGGVLKQHSEDPTRTPGFVQGPTVLVPSAEVKEGARQARAYLDGVTLTDKTPRPTESVRFLYKQVKPKTD